MTIGSESREDSEVNGPPSDSADRYTISAQAELALVATRVISFATLCWIVGTVASILVHAIQVARFLRLVARREALAQSLVCRVKQVAATLGVRPPRVLVVRGIRSPVIWGSVRAQLVWSACLPADFESGRWDGVIAHELAHLRRRDHWVGWLELIAGCLWWWNPLFWYVRHQLRENAELACDALVVWALPDGRRTYAESLIEVVSHFSPVATPVPVLGVNSVARQAFERRLTMILSERVPWKLSARAMLAIGLLALVALPGWSLAQVPAKTPDSAVAAPVNQKPALDPAATPSPDVKGEFPVTPALNADPKNPFEFFVGVFDSAPPQSPGSDQRMDAVEKQLEALIAEVKAMRASRNAPVPVQLAVPADAESRRKAAERIYAASKEPFVQIVETAELKIMTRAEYKFPKVKAEALAAFLREHMKSPVEVKVDDDSLTVTASPEEQTTIGQFIALSEGKQPPSSATWPTTDRLFHQVYPAPQPKPAAPSPTSVPAKKPAVPDSDPPVLLRN